MSRLEQQFLDLWNLETTWASPEREYKFHPTRRWRFDFAWPGLWVAVEVHGGTFTGGRHSRGIGQASDFEKFNEASRMGWTVLHFVGRHLSEEPEWVIGLVQEVLSNSGQKLKVGPDKILDAGSM